MVRFFTFLICLFALICAVAQINVTGTIIDKESDEPLAGASVIIKDASGKIKKYAISNRDGGFAISLPVLTGYRLEATMMSFSKKSIPLDSISFPIIIELEPGTTVLKEVTVKADRIKEQGDTIIYNVGTFAQEQDRSIGDVLKRMPGINVDNSGKIQYQGEDINKFYIEGSDLLGGKYGIATNGINHDDVGAVEVMENHQPMQVLSGISFSDKAAINLKLKNKAKAAWSFHGDAGGGYSWQPDGAIWTGELFAMVVTPNFQNITTFKTNNIGEDLSAQATDFFASRRETNLSRYVGVSLPSVPNLSRKRTLFNRSALVSSNNLWKLNHGELKAQIDYTFNRIASDAANITTYFLNDGNRIVTENRNGVDRSRSLSGKVIYELNQKTAFINNTLKTNIDWDDMSLGVTGSLPNDQTVSLPDYYVSNDFKLIKRFNDSSKTHLITFTSKNEWESMPQTLSVLMNEDAMHQHVKDHAFYTHESVAYAFSFNKFTVSLEGGVKGYWRSMKSGMSHITNLPGQSELLTNVINTNYFTIFATPKIEYWLKRVNFTLNAPVSYAHYTFNKALANRNEAYFSPSLSINWKPNNRVSLGVRGGSGRAPMNLSLIQPGYVMTSYRSFRQGVDDFYNSTSQSISANIAYKHARRGFFANALVLQSWSHMPYTLAQQLFGDYVVYSYSPAKSDGQSFLASGSIGKTLNFMRGSANISGAFNRYESHLLSENKSVNSIGTSWSLGARINGSPLSWLSFDYRFDWASSRITMNQTKASWLGKFENELMLNVMPHKKWEWHISGEHYSNEISADKFKNVLLLDTKLIFKLSKRLELSGSLNNILNKRTYNYTTYNQLTSFESQRWLRGRELLISISLRK